ncbi:MAG: aminotransferase class IV [Isosphaeraceae bacterium]
MDQAKMIWTDGQVLPEEALKVGILDRTFEHGLGLFETLRTWRRRAPLLDRHLARMRRSASELGLPFETLRIPDASSVAALLDAEPGPDDVVLRITLSGGLSATMGGTLWMRTLPLPKPARPEGMAVEIGSWTRPGDSLARHKTLNYWSRRRAFESAGARGFDEILQGFDSTGHRKVLEGSRTNLFCVRGSTLFTPSTRCPIVPGIMRALVIEQMKTVDGLDLREVDGFHWEDLRGAEEVFLTNSVRGIVPVGRLVTSTAEAPRDWPADRPWTQRLSRLVNDWLRKKGLDHDHGS